MPEHSVTPVSERVSLRVAELVEVEWSLRQRLDTWDDWDEGAREATERAHGKVLAALRRADAR